MDFANNYHSLQPLQSGCVHRDEVCRIANFGESGFMSISQDGCLAFWKKGLALEKTIRLPQPDPTKPNKATWITDCVVVPGQNRIFTFTGGTSDHTLVISHIFFLRSRHIDLRLDLIRAILPNIGTRLCSLARQSIRQRKQGHPHYGRRERKCVIVDAEPIC